MKKNCENKQVTLKEWLTCGMCWEVKSGLLLLLLSFILMQWGAGLVWKLGQGCYWVAVAILVAGLIRDLWLIVQRK